MNKVAIITALSSALLFSGCTSGSVNDTEQYETYDDGIETLDVEDMFTSRDLEYNYVESECVKISLDNENITLTEEGIYILSGEIENGQIIVDAGDNDKIQLVLAGVNINCDSSAAIYIKEADKVFITLAENCENTLTVSGEYKEIDDNNIDSVIFSKSDLTFNGQGNINIDAQYGHGIVCKDDLVITGGNYTITAEKHGIDVNDSVRIADGTFNITSGKDAVHSENEEDVSLGYVYIENGDFIFNTETDGIDASGILQIMDGTFKITTGGGSQNASTDSSGGFNPDWGSWGERVRENNSSPNFETGDETKRVNFEEDEKPEIPQMENMKDFQPPEQPNNQEESTETEEENISAKGLKADGNVIIKGGDFNIDSSDDSIHSNSNVKIDAGIFEIASGDDGLHADAKAVINNGEINITKSYEGIEGQSININGGNITLTASDDGLNAAGGADQSGLNGRPGMDNFTSNSECYISISGGTIYIDASGDGIDSNGNLTVSGGETYICGPVNGGNGALDYNGEGKITGGVVVAVGAAGMAQNFGNESTQGSILINTQNTQPAESTIELKDSEGVTILTYEPKKEYSSVVISCPEITAGKTYTISMGAENEEITMTDIIYGNMNGGITVHGGDGGNRGGRKQEKENSENLNE